MSINWQGKAALYELLALSLRLPDKTLTEALANGEFADALKEFAELNGIASHAITAALDELDEYYGQNPEDLKHALRVERTRLFVGEAEPLISPYGGIWWARKNGIAPLLFVTEEAQAVKRFMASCGIGQPEGTNEPLDSIATELEFLHFLCLIRGAFIPKPQLAGDRSFPERAYEEFYEQHFATWSIDFAEEVIKLSSIPYYRAIARILACV